MSSPTRVTIVRPYLPPSDRCVAILVRLGESLFLSAWILMLLVPTFTNWNPGYWQSVAAVLLVRLLQNSANYTSWSTSGVKPVKQ